MKLTHTMLVALLMAPILPAQATAQTALKGDPKAGAGPWRSHLCGDCHGEEGEGGFGPDLAGGRGLTFEQFRQTLRKPWGVMLAFNEQQLTDQQAADVFAYLQTLKKVDKPGEWHWAPAPASAPLGQRVYMNAVGCGQCHEPENKFARMWLGEHAKEMSFEYFEKQIYNHTDKYPRGGMGNYSRERLPEFELREIYKFLVEDLGVRASIGGALAIGDQAQGNTTYTLTITNRGVKDNGATAENMVAFVKLPAGAKVVSGTGTGYKGVQALSSLGLEPGIQMAGHSPDGIIVRPKQELSGDVVVWKIPKLVAADKLTLSFTLAGAPSPDLIKGFDGSTVWWEKPGRTAFGKKLQYFDTRTPPTGDHERIASPRLTPPAPAPAAGRGSNNN
jgi:mono/diheme cytochrome c family protein